jgi:hypothetical protein
VEPLLSYPDAVSKSGNDGVGGGAEMARFLKPVLLVSLGLLLSAGAWSYFRIKPTSPWDKSENLSLGFQ